VVDALDYLATLARLRILDMLAASEPETPADQQRAQDRQWIKRGGPNLDGQELSVAMPRRLLNDD
jgi:hypothetical protein